MKERDYIDVRDLSTLINACQILQNISPDNQPVIPSDEFAKVVDSLTTWRDALFRKIQR